jgi:hypothetical protein
MLVALYPLTHGVFDLQLRDMHPGLIEIFVEGKEHGLPLTLDAWTSCEVKRAIGQVLVVDSLRAV